jgi:multiple sugar transport system ATP-binding protein
MGQITLSGVTKRFGDVEVIPPLDLNIANGEFVVFVGPSGCGKSTLLRLIAGLEDTSAGRIVIDGQDATGVSPGRRGLAMVFQSYALYPHMTVRKNIGRAIVREPAAFLFDEPLSNLDAALRVGMRMEISELHERLKTTMIYVTHDQVEAMTMADSIVVLNAGRIEQVGSPLELYRNPRNLFVAGFIGSPKMNLFDGPEAQRHGGHTVGIRPEHIRISATDGLWRGTVGVSEHLGSDTFFHVHDTGLAPMVTVRAGGEVGLNHGDTIFLSPEADKIHRFDGNGQRL